MSSWKVIVSNITKFEVYLYQCIKLKIGSTLLKVKEFSDYFVWVEMICLGLMTLNKSFKVEVAIKRELYTILPKYLDS